MLFVMHNQKIRNTKVVKKKFLEVTKGRRAGVIGYQLLKDVVAAVPVA